MQFDSTEALTISVIVEQQQSFRNILDKKHKTKLNNTLEQSLDTTYSRLAKVQPPEPKERTPKWTAEDWERHESWLRLRAAPKVIPMSENDFYGSSDEVAANSDLSIPPKAAATPKQAAKEPTKEPTKEAVAVAPEVAPEVFADTAPTVESVDEVAEDFPR